MQFRELFVLSRGTKGILSITFIVSLLAVAFAYFYYRDINRSEDPRILSARKFLLEFDRHSGGPESMEAFHYLDSAAAVLRSFPEYASSFEMGVIFNNKCSGLLLKALYDSTINEQEKGVLLELSMAYCDSSIFVYQAWLEEWGGLPETEISLRIQPWMDKVDPAFRGRNLDKMIARRVKNMITAQTETRRRLSVSLTNQGTIYRHLQLPDSSIACLRRALSLWEENRIARSNLNVLLGGEPIKPSLIESLFPPDKDTQ